MRREWVMVAYHGFKLTTITDDSNSDSNTNAFFGAASLA
jgi:hypothetical protein